MNKSQVLHTYARQLLYTQYGNVLSMIRNHIETLRPEEFETVHDLQAALIVIGQTASSERFRTHFDNHLFETILKEATIKTPKDLQRQLKQATDAATSKSDDDYPPNITEEQKAAIRRARDWFCAQIASVDLDHLPEVEPLPYRRMLRSEEARVVWERAVKTWDLDGFGRGWYPISGPPRPPVAFAFEAELFETFMVEDKAANKLIEILSAHHVGYIFQFSEFSPRGVDDDYFYPDSEIELAGYWWPEYGGLEKLYFSQAMDWMIYTSHEGSITVHGQWLIDAIKAIWPDWEAATYEKFPIARAHLGNYQPDA